VEEFFLHYGPIIVYAAIFAGSLVEGEFIVLTCSSLAYRYDSISIFILTFLAFIGSMSADQTLFFVGRRYGPRFIKKRPAWEKRVEKIFYYMRKHSTLFILTFRFIYGIRTLSPIVIGASGVAVRRFAILNFFAAMAWAILSCSAGYLLGYLLGDYIAAFLKNWEYYTKILAILIIGLVIVFMIFFIVRQKDQSRD